MVCGELPFGNEIEDPYEIFREIEQSDGLKIPKGYTDQTGVMLM